MVKKEGAAPPWGYGNGPCDPRIKGKMHPKAAPPVLVVPALLGKKKGDQNVEGKPPFVAWGFFRLPKDREKKNDYPQPGERVIAARVLSTKKKGKKKRASPLRIKGVPKQSEKKRGRKGTLQSSRGSLILEKGNSLVKRRGEWQGLPPEAVLE